MPVATPVITIIESAVCAVFVSKRFRTRALLADSKIDEAFA